MSERLAILTLVAVVGCQDFDYEFEGRYVVVGTDVVDRVCEGTLAELDRDVEFIDEQLGFEHPSTRIKVAVVNAVDAGEHCGRLGVSCAWTHLEGGSVFIRAQEYERGRAHELTHIRVGDEANPSSVRLFLEGIATAFQPAMCPPKHELPSADELLAAKSSRDLGDGGYYLGGELVAWLLDTYGSERVLAFMDDLRRPDLTTLRTEPEVVRALYRQHFGREFDDDIHAHMRDPDSLTPAQVGCVAPAVPREDQLLRLQAELSCDSDQVQNDFRVPGRGFVEWTLDVPEIGRYQLLDKLPADTWLAIEPCTCDLYPISLKSPEVSWGEETHVGASAELPPATYLVRWYGPYDRGAELDIEIAVTISPP